MAPPHAAPVLKPPRVIPAVAAKMAERRFCGALLDGYRTGPVFEETSVTRRVECEGSSRRGNPVSVAVRLDTLAGAEAASNDVVARVPQAGAVVPDYRFVSTR